MVKRCVKRVCLQIDVINHWKRKSDDEKVINYLIIFKQSYSNRKCLNTTLEITVTWLTLNKLYETKLNQQVTYLGTVLRDVVVIHPVRTLWPIIPENSPHLSRVVSDKQAIPHIRYQ